MEGGVSSEGSEAVKQLVMRLEVVEVELGRVAKAQAAAATHLEGLR